MDLASWSNNPIDQSIYRSIYPITCPPTTPTPSVSWHRWLSLILSRDMEVLVSSMTWTSQFHPFSWYGCLTHPWHGHLNLIQSHPVSWYGWLSLILSHNMEVLVSSMTWTSQSHPVSLVIWVSWSHPWHGHLNLILSCDMDISLIHDMDISISSCLVIWVSWFHPWHGPLLWHGHLNLILSRDMDALVSYQSCHATSHHYY